MGGMNTRLSTTYDACEVSGSTLAGPSPEQVIVRELAERDAPYDNETGGCLFCPDMSGWYTRDHHPSCLWRRARALYPKAVAPE